MPRAQRILVIVDPAADRQPALMRAAAIASALDLQLELFICLHEGLPRPRASSEALQVRTSLLEQQLGYLKQLTRSYPQPGISTKVVWDRPLHEAIIRETLRCEARFVMKYTPAHPSLAHTVFSKTDWQLVRDCPAPLWLVGDEPWPERPVISAFVDPLHEHDVAAELDHRILAEATLLAEKLGGAAHAVHCFFAAHPLAEIPVVADQAAADVTDLEQEHAAGLAKVAAAHHIPHERTHLRCGTPAQSIPQVARELGVNLSVIGAVARSRLQKALLGSTAERVLEELGSDVLVIKPIRFESPVTYRAQAADFMELC